MENFTKRNASVRVENRGAWKGKNVELMTKKGYKKLDVQLYLYRRTGLR